jgi:hypothetical protein
VLTPELENRSIITLVAVLDNKFVQLGYPGCISRTATTCPTDLYLRELSLLCFAVGYHVVAGISQSPRYHIQNSS